MSTPLGRVLGRRSDPHQEEIARLRADVDRLQAAVEESRRLNERLSDVLDVVVELLVPAVDRDEERLSEAHRRL
jgi:hypothetical protein